MNHTRQSQRGEVDTRGVTVTTDTHRLGDGMFWTRLYNTVTVPDGCKTVDPVNMTHPGRRDTNRGTASIRLACEALMKKGTVHCGWYHP